MRLRCGFVSNSSSSSFIVAIDPNYSGKFKMLVEVDLADRSDKRITTIEQLNAYFIENHFWYSKDSSKDSTNILKNILTDKYLKKIYNKMKASIKQGQHILVGAFESDGDEVARFLCATGLPTDNKDIHIIENEAGY